MINFQDFKRLVTILYDGNKIRSEWLDKIPREVNEIFFDTPYINTMYNENTVMGKHIFGELWPDVDWFISESRNQDSCVFIDDVKIPTFTLDEYFAYAEKYLFSN